MRRRAVFLVGGGLLATWLVAAAQQPRVPAPSPDAEQAIASTAAVDSAELLAREIQSQAARLREHLAAVPQPREGRNPFAFGEARQESVPRLARAGAAPADDEPPVITIDEPVAFTLSGIAEDGPADALTRTAVLSGFGDVFLVKAGETVASRYRVVAVAADAVELEDLTTGRTIRLGLR